MPLHFKPFYFINFNNFLLIGVALDVSVYFTSVTVPF
jgi:hypothetical protein